MTNPLNALQNNYLAQLTQNAPKSVVNAIKTASAKTGVNFSYLVEKAAAESSFNPTAKAKTSSATGLFQFIESTWMDMVEKHGDKYGINANQSRRDILELRKDPKIASFMAAEFAQGNREHLEKTVGGDIGNTELYFAHFMGAGGASAFLNQLHKNPNAPAADIFPEAARANRSIFYDRASGRAKTFQEIYDRFDKKFSDEYDAPATSPAHKPTKSEGYQHLPPSLKKPTEIREVRAYDALNSLYQMRTGMDAFFSKTNSQIFPSSLYGNISNETSLMLALLK